MDDDADGLMDDGAGGDGPRAPRANGGAAAGDDAAAGAAQREARAQRRQVRQCRAASTSIGVGASIRVKKMGTVPMESAHYSWWGR